MEEEEDSDRQREQEGGLQVNWESAACVPSPEFNKPNGRVRTLENDDVQKRELIRRAGRPKANWFVIVENRG